MAEISIVIPCYNQAQWLPEALESVIGQSFVDWECIIVNDASSDGTENVALEWCRKDSRFRYVASSHNLRLPGARNLGIKVAKGKYILPLDADDKITPDYCSSAMDAFQRQPDAKIVYGNSNFFGDATGKWDLPDYQYAYLFCRNPIHCCAFFRKTDWETVGGYDESFTNSYEDWDFWLSIINERDLVIQLQMVGLLYRKSGNSMSALFHANQQNITESFRQLFNKHVEKFRNWQENRLLFFLQAYAIQNTREQKIKNVPIARFFYKVAKWMSR